MPVLAAQHEPDLTGVDHASPPIQARPPDSEGPGEWMCKIGDGVVARTDQQQRKGAEQTEGGCLAQVVHRQGTQPASPQQQDGRREQDVPQRYGDGQPDRDDATAGQAHEGGQDVEPVGGRVQKLAEAAGLGEPTGDDPVEVVGDTGEQEHGQRPTVGMRPQDEPQEDGDAEQPKRAQRVRDCEDAIGLLARRLTYRSRVAARRRARQRASRSLAQLYRWDTGAKDGPILRWWRSWSTTPCGRGAADSGRTWSATPPTRSCTLSPASWDCPDASSRVIITTCPPTSGSRRWRWAQPPCPPASCCVGSPRPACGDRSARQILRAEGQPSLQAGRGDPTQQLAGGHGGCAQRQRLLPDVGGHVVMITLEDASGQSQLAGESVQLLVGG